MVYSFSCFFVCHNLGFRGASCVFMYWSDDGTQVVVPIRSTVGGSQMWVIHSRELAKLVFVAILRSHLCKKYYYHRHYEHEVATLNEFVRPTLWIENSIPSFSTASHLQNLTIKIDVASFQIQTLSLKSQNILLLLQACWLHKSLYIQILMKGYQ